MKERRSVRILLGSAVFLALAGIILIIILPRTGCFLLISPPLLSCDTVEPRITDYNVTRVNSSAITVMWTTDDITRGYAEIEEENLYKKGGTLSRTHSITLAGNSTIEPGTPVELCSIYEGSVSCNWDWRGRHLDIRAPG